MGVTSNLQTKLALFFSCLTSSHVLGDLCLMHNHMLLLIMKPNGSGGFLVMFYISMQMTHLHQLLAAFIGHGIFAIPTI